MSSKELIDNLNFKTMTPKEKAVMEEATFNFSQEANCISENDGAEFLEIKCLSDLGIDRNDGDCFYVLKTDGWSIDSVEELQELFDRISKSLKLKNNNNETNSSRVFK